MSSIFTNIIIFRLDKKIEEFSVKVAYNSGKIEVSLKKQTLERWNSIGTPLKGHESWVQEGGLPQVEDFPTFKKWRLLSKTLVTHDVNHYIFEPTKKVRS